MVACWHPLFSLFFSFNTENISWSNRLHRKAKGIICVCWMSVHGCSLHISDVPSAFGSVSLPITIASSAHVSCMSLTHHLQGKTPLYFLGSRSLCALQKLHSLQVLGLTCSIVKSPQSKYEIFSVNNLLYKRKELFLPHLWEGHDLLHDEISVEAGEFWFPLLSLPFYHFVPAFLI